MRNFPADPKIHARPRYLHPRFWPHPLLDMFRRCPRLKRQLRRRLQHPPHDQRRVIRLQHFVIDHHLVWFPSFVVCPNIFRTDPDSPPKTSDTGRSTPVPPALASPPAPANAPARCAAALPTPPFPKRSNASIPPPATSRAVAPEPSRTRRPSPVAPKSAAASDPPAPAKVRSNVFELYSTI